MNIGKKLLAGVGILSLLAGAASAFTTTIDRINPGTSIPVVTSCGTSPAITGADLAGSVTVGTASPTSCTLTFSAAFSATPFCVVGSNPQLAAFSWTISTTAIVITQTGTASNKITWVCMGS